MNKKAFTLVELLAVLVIIGIIALITVPVIQNVINDSKVKACNQQLYTIKKAAQNYVTDLIANGQDVPTSVSISTLYTNGFLDDLDIKNPVTGEAFGSDFSVSITSSDDMHYKYSFENDVCVVSSGSGGSEENAGKDFLELASEDETLYEESGRYVFKGANPNNAIEFNGDVWRIMSYESDGTLKIAHVSKLLGDDDDNIMMWNEMSEASWQTSSLKAYLNGDYYDNLSDEAKQLIVSHQFNDGRVMMTNTIGTIRQSEINNGTKTSYNVGLISLSDYLNANDDLDNCGTLDMVNSNEACAESNYIAWPVYNSVADLWTITRFGNVESSVFYIDSNWYPNVVGAALKGAPGDEHGVIPVVYLKSGLKLTGSGAGSNPYKIVSD
ncbi:MAG: type II secretion system protein [Bacilli bacterium]|nr:type II secretion system protein [Bacilli bacterium]